MLAEAGEYKHLKIIGITGTKGKSTTSLVTNHILNGLGHRSAVFGNIGVPFLNAIDKFNDYDYLVLELSSYQVQSLSYMLDYSIVLNLFPEHIHWHLNHYNYFGDKLSIMKYSKKSIINGNDAIIKEHLKNGCKYFGTNEGFFLDKNFIKNKDKKVCDITSITNIRGEHIFRNICGVLTFLDEENIDVADAVSLLNSFRTIEHRLEIFYENKERNTIFVNDSISTIPESTIEALKTFSNNAKLFLVLGGFDRQQDYGNLVNFISENKNIKKIFLIGQTGKKLRELLIGVDNEYFETLEKLVEAIKVNNLDNTTVLLSPAAPSYDMFKNFEERGGRFKKLMCQSL
jgi:UDP-N-acetylmuramoylalanine--D-glutamate ligase